LVEGYFDLLSLWSAGIESSVATLGTALTADQVDLIRRFTRNVIILFDPDEAGQKAMRRSLELFLPAGMQAKVVVLADGHDPDSYIRTFGSERMASVIENAFPLVDYFIEEVIGKACSFEDLQGVTREAVSLMARIENPLEKDLFIKRVSERLAIDHESLKREIHLATKPREDKIQAAVQRPKKTTDDTLELGLLHLLLEYPDRIPAIYEGGVFKYFIDEETKSLGEILWQAYADHGPGNFNSSFVLGGLTEGPLRERLLRMMIDPPPYGSDVLDRALEDMGKQLRRRWFRQRQLILREELSKAETRGDRDGCLRILEEKNRLMMEERGALKAKGL
ncbi:MAG: toprim domain-containing protein, partial [Smithellaceae bacterium]|nr:toprim domain-containing protein [Smithellaceae bacterium]